MSWVKGGESLFGCLGLENLGLDGYSGSSLGKIADLTGLREFGLSNASKLASMEGVGILARLESLSLTRLGFFDFPGPARAFVQADQPNPYAVQEDQGFDATGLPFESQAPCVGRDGRN